MRYYRNGDSMISTIGKLDLQEITAEEYETEMVAIRERVITQEEAYERTRLFTAEEVTAMLIRQQINTLSVDDNTALRMVEFYPEWATGTDYATGFKVQYNGTLYKCMQPHASQADWTPDAAPSLWAKVLIPDETVIPEWEQPDSTNPYSKGDTVTHNGKTWVSDIDNNVWEPGVVGTENLWKQVI